VDIYNQTAGKQKIFFVEVSEQSIMEWTLLANRNGQIACTHGGECLAGLVQARQKGFIGKDEVAIVDSTAHPLKFSGFQEQYFQGNLPEAYQITSDPKLVNAPVMIQPKDLKKLPAAGKPLTGDDLDRFIHRTSDEIAKLLQLK
jgi:threonine synthase